MEGFEEEGGELANRHRIGCATSTGLFIALLLLLGIGGCAWLNSRQIAQGFPSGLTYDQVLAYDQQSGLREGCVFIAYRLSDRTVETLTVNGAKTMRAAEVGRKDGRNSYSPYQSTPLIFDGDNRHLPSRDGITRSLFALGASGGCGDGSHQLPSATSLLTEPGNFYSLTQNDEGLSVVSPSRKLALFLYFG